jgi:hypothetical protein
MEFYTLVLFSCQTQQYTNQLAHISLCIIEFIGRTMSLHVSALGAIIVVMDFQSSFKLTLTRLLSLLVELGHTHVLFL